MEKLCPVHVVGLRGVGADALAFALSLAIWAGAARAQPVAEAEPNDAAASANLAVMASGGSVTGTTTGSTGVNGNSNSPDWFRLRISATPTLVQQHRVTLSSSRSGHTGVLGVTRFGEGAVEGQVSAFQFTSVNTTPARFNQFYTFGVSTADVLLRVTGTAQTVDPYSATLASTTVTPTVLLPQIVSGTVTMTTENAGHTTDTELFLFDMSTGQLLAQNDNALVAGGGSTSLSRIVFTVRAGTGYLVASGPFDTSSNVAADPLIDAVTSGTLASSPGVLISSSTVATADLSLLVQGTWQGTARSERVALARPGPYGVAFASFTLGCNPADLAGPGQTTTPDGQLTADDIILYIARFLARNPRADLARPGPDLGSDGEFTADDLIVFIRDFAAGCPG